MLCLQETICVRPLAIGTGLVGSTDQKVNKRRVTVIILAGAEFYGPHCCRIRARVLTGNPGAHSSLRCLFFLRHREVQQQALVSWLRRRTPHILSYRLHHYGRGEWLLRRASIAGTSSPISLIAGYNGSPVLSFGESLSDDKSKPPEEGGDPPLHRV
jgi:hypothetical protein